MHGRFTVDNPSTTYRFIEKGMIQTYLRQDAKTDRLKADLWSTFSQDVVKFEEMQEKR